MMHTARYLGQLAILWGICLFSDWLAALTSLPVPGNVLGVVLLFSLLCLNVIKVEQVADIADFLLRHLVFFFVPIVAGLMDWGGMFQEHGLALAGAIVVSSLASLAACAWLARVLRREE